MASEIFCDTCGAANQPGQRLCFACGRPLTPDNVSQKPASTPPGLLATHMLLKQRYRILRTIGSGGMGAVYAAEDIDLGDRLVAIKEMSQQKLSAQGITDAAENFKREAHMLARLQNPNLPSIHDYFTEGGHWYLVMEFIPGETLQKYLAQHSGKLSVEEAVQIGSVLCSVLDYLHSQKPPIIFRDLKPSNIMRTPEGEIYLIDFGIARHFKPGQAKDTAAFGSAGYASPEQYGHSQTTPRSDIYSLGGVLYYMLSGRSPAQTPFNLPSLQTLNPALPSDLVALVTRMTSPDESLRPASMRAVKQELQRVAILPSVPVAATIQAQKKMLLPAQPSTVPAMQSPAPASNVSRPDLAVFIRKQASNIAHLKNKFQALSLSPQPSPAPAVQSPTPYQPIPPSPGSRWVPAFVRNVLPNLTPRARNVSQKSFSQAWVSNKRMLAIVLIGTLLCSLLMVWLDHGSFPTWFAFMVGNVSFRISLFLVLDMLTLLLTLYFGVTAGPWAGLFVGGVGTLLGDYLSYSSGHFGWNWDIRVALAGLLVGLLIRRANNHQGLTRRAIYTYCALAIILGTAFASYSDLWLRHETFAVATNIFFVYSALSLACCLLLYVLVQTLLNIRSRIQSRNP
jgi:serine/threonine protein kinase/uncharacterized membrane protein